MQNKKKHLDILCNNENCLSIMRIDAIEIDDKMMAAVIFKCGVYNKLNDSEKGQNQTASKNYYNKKRNTAANTSNDITSSDQTVINWYHATSIELFDSNRRKIPCNFCDEVDRIVHNSGEKRNSPLYKCTAYYRISKTANIFNGMTQHINFEQSHLVFH